MVTGCPKNDPVPPNPPPIISKAVGVEMDSTGWDARFEQQGIYIVLKSFDVILRFNLRDEDHEKIETNWTADVVVSPETEQRVYDVFACSGTIKTCNDVPMGRVNGKVARGGQMRPMMFKLQANNGVLEVKVGSTRVKPDGQLFPNYIANCGLGCNSFEPVATAVRVPNGKNKSTGEYKYLYAGAWVYTPKSINTADSPYFGVRWTGMTNEEAENEWQIMRARWLSDPETQPQAPQSQISQQIMLSEPPLSWTTCPCLPFSDTDGDGLDNCLDLCPDDPNKIIPGTNGCGIPENVTFCTQFDYDLDGDIDQDDFGEYQRNEIYLQGFDCCFSGANVMYNLYCGD